MNKIPKNRGAKLGKAIEPLYWHVPIIGDSFPSVKDQENIVRKAAYAKEDLKSTKPHSVCVVDYDPHALVMRSPEADKTESVSKIKLKLQDIQDAHNRIKNDVVFTPIMEAKYIGKKFCKVFFKCENLQHTGSFKARGACNVLASMSPIEKSKGCTISGGRNFLAAMTHYGHKQSIPINVVVPKDCPLSERQRYKENFALVKMYGSCSNEASLHALSYCDEIGSKYIHGSDRLDLLAGYGTLGLELLTQLDQLDAIICPVGSGGLVASLVLAVKSLKPNCLIYGVECAAAPVVTRALQEKKPVMVQPSPTIADSLCQAIASNNAFNIIRSYLDRMITVEELWISRAIITLLEREKMLVEGAAACSVAAVMADKVPELSGKNVVCVLTGGNVNTSRVARVLDRGMAGDGRLVRFATTLPDVPGAMAALLARVHEVGADVRSFVPERAWMKRDIFSVSVNMLMETCDMNHSKELEKKLMKDYPDSHFIICCDR